MDVRSKVPNVHLLLSGPINTPHPLAHFTPILASNPSGAPSCENHSCVSVLCKICEFEASGVEVLEVSLQGGNARLPNSLITSLCCSIIVLC